MSMLNLENILWVVPGTVFIYFYNRNRCLTRINLSGWPYIFFLVLIATISWIPAKIILEIECVRNFFHLSNHFYSSLLTVIFSLIFILIYLIILPLFESYFPSIYDNFYRKCIEWENELIIITLKNEKAYIALLWKYPEIPNSRYETQTISIVPYLSGYRHQETKKIEWNIPYPMYKDENQIKSMEIIVPRSEIITLGKFNREFFYSSNSLIDREKSLDSQNEKDHE